MRQPVCTPLLLMLPPDPPPVQVRLQVHSAAAAWYARAKLFQLCRSEL